MFKSGKKANRVADALSRQGAEKDDGCLDVISFPLPLWLHELKSAYLQDHLVQ